MSEPSEELDPVEPSLPPELPAASDEGNDPTSRRRLRQTDRRKTSTKSAARWVLFVAIMQLAIGTYLGIEAQATYDKALEDIAWMSAEYRPEGRETIGELRVMLERERIQVLAIPIGIGLLFVALFFWARKSPLPALITALALFVVVHAVTGVIDPSEIPRGFLVKVLFIAALIKGIRSALEDRVMSTSIEAGA